MKDITNIKAIYAKGLLFLGLGLLAAIILILRHPEGKDVLLLIVAVWSLARFYYFGFYVIEHYVDPSYKFSGFYSFVLYLLRKRKESRKKMKNEE